MRVHVHGDGSRDRAEWSDAEVIYGEGRIQVYLYDEFSAWSKGGKKSRHAHRRRR